MLEVGGMTNYMFCIPETNNTRKYQQKTDSAEPRGSGILIGFAFRTAWLAGKRWLRETMTHETAGCAVKRTAYRLLIGHRLISSQCRSFYGFVIFPNVLSIFGH